MSNSHPFRSLKAERDILQTLHRRRRQYAELQKFASGGAIVVTGWVLAAVYSLMAHVIPV